MYTVEELEAKVKALQAQIEQSAANHHVLLGSKITWESMLADIRRTAEEVKDAAVAVEAALDAAGKI